MVLDKSAYFICKKYTHPDEEEAKDIYHFAFKASEFVPIGAEQTDEFWALGDPFMRKYYTIFDI